MWQIVIYCIALSKYQMGIGISLVLLYFTLEILPMASYFKKINLSLNVIKKFWIAKSLKIFIE